MWFGVDMIVLGMALCAMVFTYVNAYPNAKYLQYGFAEQIKDMIQPIIMSVIMSVCVYMMSFININRTILLFVQIVVGMLIYVLLSLITKNKEFNYIKAATLKFLAGNEDRV